MEIFLLIGGSIVGGICGWYLYNRLNPPDIQIITIQRDANEDLTSPRDLPSLNLEINNWFQSNPNLKAHYFPDSLKGYLLGSSTSLCGRMFNPTELTSAAHLGFEDRCTTCTKLKNGD